LACPFGSQVGETFGLDEDGDEGHDAAAELAGPSVATASASSNSAARVASAIQHRSCEICESSSKVVGSGNVHVVGIASTSVELKA
jgi:hypothetical protein